MSNMAAIVPVVEGDGETNSCPILLPRLAAHLGLPLQFARALNAHGRDNILKGGGFERLIRVAAMTPGCSGILTILDGEGTCAKELAHNLATRARGLSLVRPVVIVVAVPMYEAWLLGSLAAIAGKTVKGRPGIPAGTVLDAPGGPEEIRNPKNWLKRHLPRGRGYHETSDQPALTAHMDLDVTRASCRSFSRLVHALQELAVQASSPGRGWVSPAAPPVP